MMKHLSTVPSIDDRADRAFDASPPSATIYVASSSREMDRADRAFEAADRLGYTNTFDWRSEIKKHGSDLRDTRLDSDRMANALQDIDAVLAADFLWFLIPSTPSTGSWAELGAAIAFNRLLSASRKAHGRAFKVIIASFESVSHVPDITPLFATPSLMFESDEHAGNFLRLMNGRNDPVVAPGIIR